MLRKGAEAVPLEKLSFWEELEQDDQSTMRKATEAANAAYGREKESRMETGENLFSVRRIVKTEKRWLEYCRTQLEFSIATAYRRIDEYKKVHRRLPKPLVAVAKELKINISQRFIEKNPPPETDDRSEMIKYLERGSKPQRKVVTLVNHEKSARTAFHAFDLQFRRLSSRSRPSFVNRHVGMIMTLAGITHKQVFDPVAVPESFHIHPGRPRIRPRAA